MRPRARTSSADAETPSHHFSLTPPPLPDEDFLKHAPPQTGARGDVELGAGAVSTSDGGLERDAPGTVTLRHVLLNDMVTTPPGAPLGIDFGVSTRGGALLSVLKVCVRQGAVCPEGGAAGAAAAAAASGGADAGAGGAAAEEPLIRVGDYVVGVSGSSAQGMSVEQLNAAISAVRSSSATGVFVLHLVHCPINADDAVRLQMAQAARQLLGSQEAVIAAYQTQWQAIYGAAVPL